MPLYETTFIARQDITTQEVENLTELFRTEITGEKSKVVKEEYWGLRSLPYKIKKNKKGHFIFFGIDSDIESVNELNRKLKLHDDVLRAMTVRVENIDKEPTPFATSSDSKSSK